MDLQQPPELVMDGSVGDKVRAVLVAVAVPGVLLAVVLAIGLPSVTMATAVAFVAIVALFFWRATFAALAGTPPALTAAGVRLRPRPGRVASAVLPWSEVTSIGLLPTTVAARTYLKVTAADAARFPGPRKDGINFIYLSPTVVTPQQVRDAVQWFTHGRLVARDEPPQRSLARP